MPSASKADAPKVYISGIGAHLPDHSVTNETLAKLTGIDPEWIHQRTGITRRYLSKAGERTSNLAARAGREAMAQAQVAPGEIDLLLVASSFPDAFPPHSTSAAVKNKLGLTHAHVVDINTPVSGFLYALRFARDSIAAGTVKAALVIGAESFSSVSDLNDRRTCYLFSDGAGALLLTKKKGFASVSAVRVGNPDRPEQVDWCETADDSEPFSQQYSNIPGLAETVTRALEQVLGKKAPATAVHLLSQQVTARTEVKAREGVQVFDGFADCAYLLSASLPVALYHLLRWGECKPRERAMLFSADGRGAWCTSLVDVLTLPAWNGSTATSTRADMPQLRDPSPEQRELFTCSKEDAHKMLETEARRADPARGHLVCLALRMQVGGNKELRHQVERETRTILTGNTRASDSLLRLEGAASYAVVLREVDLSDAQRLCARLVNLLEEVDLAGEFSVKVDSRVSAHAPGKAPATFARDVLSGLTAVR